MSTEVVDIRVNRLAVQIVRKDIKNLHLGVYPPNGRVRVAAPLAVSNEAVRLAVISKLGWIKKQQAKFAAQPRQTEREMVSGESHYYLGRRYRLRLIEHDGAARVSFRGKSSIDLYIRKGSKAGEREQLLLRWYRAQLKALIPPFLNKWQPVLGVQVADWGIKKMKTKWGSCNSNERRIWLNLELAKKPVECLEYIVFHEMVHLLEWHHNDRFQTLMNQFMPKWRLCRDRLNQEPLGHERWAY